MKEIVKIRNFTIIAHIDHGKSTLADRILQLCNAVKVRDFKEQMLDNMDLERERGITIKAQTVRLNWLFQDKEYTLNLIDTPGHSDFSYEVSRSLAACENSLLLVDATKGVEAQTVSNFYKALEANHLIIPVINKIDMPFARIEMCLEELEKLGFKKEEVCYISAKTGQGVKELLDKLIEEGKKPVTVDSKTRALVVDSWYEKYYGVCVLVRVFDGAIEKNSSLTTHSNNKNFSIVSLEMFVPQKEKVNRIDAGEIGAIITNIRNPLDVKIGDTIFLEKTQIEPIPGFKESKPLVFCTMYPEENSLAPRAKEAMEKYILNDSAFTYTIENSDLYGIGFTCGFLGILHMEIVRERIEREFGVKLLCALPSVIYRVKEKGKDIRNVYGADDWPLPDKIEYTEEPECLCEIFLTRSENIGRVIELCMSKRPVDFKLDTQDDKTIITCKMPLAEIITDFCDKLQSISSGFASLDYSSSGYREGNLCKLIVMVNEEIIREFAFVTHMDRSKSLAKHFASKLKDLIPRGQVKIKIQVAIDTPKNVVAREDINPYRKDVIAHCYGGDITRKKKLLEKQKSGKEKMLSKGGRGILKDMPKHIVKDLFRTNEE